MMGNSTSSGAAPHVMLTASVPCNQQPGGACCALPPLSPVLARPTRCAHAAAGKAHQRHQVGRHQRPPQRRVQHRLVRGRQLSQRPEAQRGEAHVQQGLGWGNGRRDAAK